MFLKNKNKCNSSSSKNNNLFHNRKFINLKKEINKYLRIITNLFHRTRISNKDKIIRIFKTSIKTSIIHTTRRKIEIDKTIRTNISNLITKIFRILILLCMIKINSNNTKDHQVWKVRLICKCLIKTFHHKINNLIQTKIIINNNLFMIKETSIETTEEDTKKETNNNLITTIDEI